MPSRTTSTHRFRVSEAAEKPTARVTPAEATGVIGASVTLSAQESTVGGVSVEGMEFSWTLMAPSGSLIEDVTIVEPDGSQVRVDSDVTGTYAVSLIVTYAGVSSDPVTCGVFFSPVTVPAVKRIVPDGRFMFSVLSDFWSLVNDREVFPIVWSSYTQIVASDLLRALQIDRAKSIQTIQPLFQKRFIEVSPKIDLDYSKINLIIGNHQSGDSAFTGQVSFVGTGIIVSRNEFLLGRLASEKAVGASLVVYTGENAGEYTIKRLNAARNGFIVSETKQFPSFRSTIRVSGSDMVSLGSSILYSASVDLVAAGVAAGDYLRLTSSDGVGYYKVSAVGTADGLVTDRHVEVELPVSAGTGLHFSVFEAVRVSYSSAPTSFTNTVYIPKDDANLASFDTATLTSSGGRLLGDYEITVDPRHVIDSAIDKKIRITSGSVAGRSFSIAALNEARTGFYVTEAIPAASFPESISYSIELNASLKDRLIILDGEAYRIGGYTLLEGLPTQSEGGRGDLWAISLVGSQAPAGIEGIRWRISSTVESEEIEDFTALGVSAGDKFLLNVYRTDLQKSSSIECQITGAAGNRFSFELGTSPLVAGTAGSLSAENTIRLSQELSIPTVSESVSGEAVYTSSALDIYGYLYGARFASSSFNYALDAETDLDIDGYFSVELRPASIIRNSKIALDPDGEYSESPIFSIPALHEYVAPPTVEQTEEGLFRLVAKDGTVTIVSRPPESLVENVNYSISGQVLTFSESYLPSNPAPEVLWAPLVLVDNFKYIEDNFGVLVGTTKAQLDEFGSTAISYRAAISGLMHSWATGPTVRSAETGAHILLDAPVTEVLGEIVEIEPNYSANRGRILIEDIDNVGAGKGIYRAYLYPNNSTFRIERFQNLAVNPLTGSTFAEGDIVPPYTPLSQSVVVTDRVEEPGWWKKYSSVSGAQELQKYHSWQAEFDLVTVDSRDIPLAVDFLMKIRPIYTLPTFVGVLSLQDVIEVEDSVFIDGNLFLFDDPAFSRESSHILDAYNESGLSTRLLDFGSYSTRTLFKGTDLEVDVADPTLVTSARGGFVSGSTDANGDQILPGINSYFQDDIYIRGSAFVREGDILFITTGRNRGRFLVDTVVDDHSLRISQYLDSSPRGIDPTTHMRTDSNAEFHIQRYEDELIVEGSGISATGIMDNVVVVSSATFWSDGVTADDILVILSGNNRGIYHIEDLGEYNVVSELFENEETTLTLRTVLADPSDLAHPFEIRRRSLLENPSFSATDGVTSAGVAKITSASSPDLAFIVKGDTLVPSTGSDADVVFRVIGVSGDDIYTDLAFTASETDIEFSVSHAAFAVDDYDSDARLERLHAYDEIEVTLYRPVSQIYTGLFTLTDNGDPSNPVSQAVEESSFDLSTVPVQAGDSLEVEIVSSMGATTSVSHGIYEIVVVDTDTLTLVEYFPGVTLSSGTLLEETGVSCNICTPDADFSVSGTSVTSASTVLEDIGIVPGDIFEDESFTQYLIIGVSASTLTLAEDTGVTATMSGRILRKEIP